MISPGQYLSQSDVSLAAARMLHDGGFVAAAVSRGYYAAFYVASALLARDGIHLRKHTAVISRFGVLFARTRALDPRYHWLLMQGHQLRKDADYGPWEELPNPGQSEWIISETEEFLLAVREFIGSQA